MFDLRNKKRISKKTSKIAMIFFAFILTINTFGSLAYAAPTVGETSGVYDQNGNLNIGKCIKQGNFDFMAFLEASIWSDSFVESILEPWKDVLVRNTCQAFDIYGLVLQQDKLRKQIRDAFLTCRNDKVPKLEIAYHKTVVEIAFARNIVYGGLIVKQYKDMDSLLAEFKDKYVGYNWFQPEEFDVFGNELKVRYADRQRAYVDECDQGSWAEVKRKFEEFNKQVIQGGFVEDIKKEGTNLVRKAKDVEKAFGDAKSWEEWGKGLGQVNLNGSPCSAADTSGCADFWTEFSREFNENNPFTKTNFPSTTEGVFETRKWTDFALKQATLKIEMSTRFQMLYGVAADSTLQEFINAAEQMNTIIKDSFTPLNKLKECTKSVGNKQCK